MCASRRSRVSATSARSTCLVQLPETFVFSSDYPHHEGNDDPINLYGSELDAVDDELRTSFLGANIEDCFARMGDPLPAR